MNAGKKISHTAESFKGRFKKAVGRLTGSRRLEAEGRGDEVKGDVKQAGAKIRDPFES